MKKSLIYTMITAVLFSTLEPVSKLIASDVSAYAITFWRFIIGSFVLIAPAMHKTLSDKVKISVKDILLSALLGILFICVSMISLQYAVKIADNPSLTAIIFSANSIFTIILAAIIIKEKLTKYKIFALIFGIVGVLLCINYRNGAGNASSFLLAVFAAVSFSLYTVLSKKYTQKAGVIQTFLVFIFGSVILLLFLIAGGVDIIPPLNPKNIFILLYLGIFVTGIGYACYFKAIEENGTIMGSLAFLIKPVLTPFVTYIINGIKPTAIIYFSVIMICISSYFAVFKKHNS